MKALDNPMTPTTKGLLVIGGGVLLVGGAITAGVLLSRKSSSTSTTTTSTPPKTGGTGPSKPGTRTQAVWVPITINSETTAIYPPVGATVAVSVPGGDPGLPGLQQSLPKGATRSPAGNSAPTGFPNDGRGTKAFRAIYTAPDGQGLAVTRSTLAWIQKIETVTLKPIVTA